MSSIVYLRNRKSNTIYAYLNESVWDESKGRNVYKRRCIGHVDPETGEIVPNRGGRTREYPVVKSRHLCDVFDSVAEGMKLTEALKLSFPDEWKKIMGIVYYLAATGGEMVFCKQWSEQHRTPYGQVITPAAMNELLSDINSNSISLFFTLWRIRLQPEETYLTTIGFGEARSSTSEYSKDLGIDLGALTDKVKMEIFFSTKDNIPICYKLSDKSTGRRLGDYDVSAGSFSRLSFFMDEVTGNPLDPSLVAYADSNLTVRVRPDSEFISGLLEKASATITNPENYRIYLGTPLFSETFMQHINGRKFYTHIFYDPNKSAEDLSTFISMINLCRYEVEMDSMVEEHAGLYDRYLIIKEDEKGDRTVELNSEAIMHHNKYLGYTVLISNNTRSAATAITPFLQRGKVARRFESMRNEYDSTALNLFAEGNYLSRIFLQFLALAIRLKVESIMDSRKLNRSMTYREVVRELDNIKTISIPGVRRPQSTFITDTQARILNAFGVPYGDRSPTRKPLTRVTFIVASCMRVGRGNQMSDLFAEGGKQLLLGNEAIVRGLIESGADFASTYPGTPSSEIGNILEKISEQAGMYFEFSVNEKVAFEVSAAAASAGLRSFTFMKHVGLNVAADPMMTLAYAGVTGGMLILSADDPSAHSSQNEQDNRYYSTLALIPMIEPSTPQEGKDMVAEAYRVSESLQLPVLYRTTTRVNHARGVVELGTRRMPKGTGHFDRDVVRFVNIPAHARVNRNRLLEQYRKAQEMSEASPLNFVEGEGDIGIITSGVSYTYVKEFVSGVSIFKIGFTNPLPEKRLAEFIRSKKAVIVVEELEPFLEDQVLRICGQNGLSVPVYGKRTGHLPRAWEFSPDSLSGIRDIVKVADLKEPMPRTEVKLPSRPPTLCAGCPHRGLFAATKKASIGKDVIFCSDIGCYTLGVQPPFNCADFIICMGGGAGAAGGFDASTNQKAIAFMGDSTFFHSGVPPLVNALFNNHKIVQVILDNRTTAMTGHQPNPGTGRDFGGITTDALDIEQLVKGVGAKFVRTVNPYNVKEAVQVMKDAIDYDGVAVVISKCPCPLELKKRKALVPRVCEVDQDKCVRCHMCLKTIACPALIKGKDGSVTTDPTQCIGCGMCADVCPKKAIEVRQ